MTDGDAGTGDRAERIREVRAQVAERGLEYLRLSFVDQHGLLRGKTIAAGQLDNALREGIRAPGSLLAKDTGNTYALPVWAESTSRTMNGLLGAGDMVLMPDAATFRVLGWAERTGWMLCDLTDVEGAPLTLSTRALCRRAERTLAALGFRYQAGLEMEFHLYRSDPDSGVRNIHPGWELLSESHGDLIEPIFEPIRNGLVDLGLPPRSIEIELGPSQIELTFAPAEGCAVADQAVLVRSAIKQLAVRNGLHATFMSRPKLPDSFPSGWHLHQSLLDRTGRNLFAPDREGDLLSTVGRHAVAGLLAHAAAASLLTTPTVTGYKRFRPHSVAPDRVAWSAQHRGAMLRVISAPGDPGSRVENRTGDPAANPYLYLASQMVAMAAGIEAAVEPPTAVRDPYAPDAGPLLPRSLGEAIECFNVSDLYRAELGDEFVDYLTLVKRSEWARFCSTVTDWEHQEYFELF